MINVRGRRQMAILVIAAAVTVAANQAEASAAGFGASWQMDDTTGPALDSSGNGNNGTVVGGVTRTGSGYDFDGATGYVTVPDSPSLDPGAADITLTARFTLNGNPTPSGADYDLVRKGLAGTQGGDYKLEILSTGKALCRFRGSAAGVIRGGTNLGVGTHELRCVKTSAMVELWVDGVLKASKTVTVGSISNSQPVILGAKPGDDFTNGLVDYITIT